MAEPFAICANDEESLACRAGAVPFIIIMRTYVRYDIKLRARVRAWMKHTRVGATLHAIIVHYTGASWKRNCGSWKKLLLLHFFLMLIARLTEIASRIELDSRASHETHADTHCQPLDRCEIRGPPRADSTCDTCALRSSGIFFIRAHLSPESRRVTRLLSKIVRVYLRTEVSAASLIRQGPLLYFGRSALELF